MDIEFEDSGLLIELDRRDSLVIGAYGKIYEQFENKGILLNVVPNVFARFEQERRGFHVTARPSTSLKDASSIEILLSKDRYEDLVSSDEGWFTSGSIYENVNIYYLNDEVDYF